MTSTGQRRSEPLLDLHPVFNAVGRTELADELARHYRVSSVDFAPSATRSAGVANRVQLAGITLHYCRYDAPTRIEFANMAGYRQFFCLSGVEHDGH